MKRVACCVTTVTVLSAVQASAESDQKTYIAYRLAKPPVVDGAVADDPAWAVIPDGSDFIIPPTRMPASEQTRFRMGYTDEALYVGVVCDETPGRQRVQARADGGGSPWRHNSVEVFLYPPGAAYYYQFMANARDERVNLLCAGTYKAVPLEPWEAKARVGKGRWSVELKIPYGIFRPAPFPVPRAGDMWTGNVCRNNFNPTGERATCWATFKATRFHTPKYFGRIVFAGPYSPEESRRVEGRIFATFYRRPLQATARRLDAAQRRLASARSADDRVQDRIATFCRHCAPLLRDASRREAPRLIDVLRLLGRLQEGLRKADALQREVLEAKHFGGGRRRAFLVTVVKPIGNPSQWIRPTDALLPGRIGTEIRMAACAGEYEPASFVVAADAEIKGLAVTATDLKGAWGVIPASAVDIRVVKCWYQAGTAGVAHAQQKDKKVLVPELLLKDDRLVKVDVGKQYNYLKLRFADGTRYVCISDPAVPKSRTVHPPADQFPVKDSPVLLPVDIPARTNKQFWITLHVPDDAKPGTYAGAIRLASKTVPPVSLDLKVRVWPIRLVRPRLTSSIYYAGNLDPSDKAHIAAFPKSRAQYRAEMQDLVAHGVTAPLIPVRFRVEGQRRVYDEEALRRVLVIRRDLGMLNGPIYLGGFLWQALNIKQPKLVTHIDLTPELREHLQRIVRQIVALARSLGATDVYFYGLDEAKGPRLTCQRASWEAIREAGGKVFVAGYSGGNFRHMGDIQDLLICAGYPSKVEADKWHSRGHRIWCYANPQGGLENAEVYRRNFGLLLWKSHYDGAATWTYMSTAGHTWNDFDSPRARDYNFVYPTVDGVIDTVQWEGYREGIDDLRYVATLEEAIRQAREATDPGRRRLAAEAQGALDTLDVETRNLDTVRLEIVGYLLALLDGR